MKPARKHPRTRPHHVDDERATPNGLVEINKKALQRRLARLESEARIDLLRERVAALRRAIAESRPGPLLKVENVEETFSTQKEHLLSELDQIIAARTIERAGYYVRRLRRAVAEEKTAGVNDINLRRWKEYQEVITDSLWVLPKRDTSGAHLGWYWGNFIPQIPHQLLLRYTKKGEWVLDPFAGSGTTLIECRRLGRNGLGLELNPETAERARGLIAEQPHRHDTVSEFIVGDARSVDLKPEFARAGIKGVQFLLLHPPYHDIIEFSDDPRDLSRAASTEEFLRKFGACLDNLLPLLDRGRYLALVIGDKYSKGEWVPLGFYCMSEVMKRGLSLKSTIVKNFEETRAKRDQKQLWRYRALAGGFYVFKHEYIFLFRKQ
jgi:DNA methylase